MIKYLLSYCTREKEYIKNQKKKYFGIAQPKPY